MDRTADLLAFLDACPSPYHAAAEAGRRLEASGFQRVSEDESWPADPGGRYLIRGGSLVAWIQPASMPSGSGFRIVGAHTDSPNLRLKPHPQARASGWEKLNVEVYGGAIWASWLDRDLGLSGRVLLGIGDGTEQRLVRIDEPLLRIPSAAIHLDRSVNTEGLKLDPQRHLSAIWGLAGGNETSRAALSCLVARELRVDAGDILAWDLMLHDVTGASMLGVEAEMISSARLDNLLSCWAAVTAITAVPPDDQISPQKPVPVICLFDHEEIGSQSASGADSSMLATVLERIALTTDADRQTWHRALARSYAVSVDGAHATHPNRPELHDTDHLIAPNGGPVVKHNANLRYASDAWGTAWLRQCAKRCEVPLQDFVMRNDMPCGSTIGPVTASRLGVTTVDIGVSQLSMHSIRELCGSQDASRLPLLLTQCLTV